MTDLQADTREILRYLGVRGQTADERLLQSVDACLAELRAAATPRCLSRLFPLVLEGNTARLGSLTIESADLANHLRGCNEAILFAATLGARVDFLLERTAKTDMGRAVVLQACAAALTESWCDVCMRPLEAEAASRGLFLRPRYSPGYGDFPLRHQPDILRLLDSPKKIGLTATERFMLVPTKSVTAVIGLTDEPSSCHIGRCMMCDAKNCPFRAPEAGD